MRENIEVDERGMFVVVVYEQNPGLWEPHGPRYKLIPREMARDSIKRNRLPVGADEHVYAIGYHETKEFDVGDALGHYLMKGVGKNSIPIPKEELYNFFKDHFFCSVVITGYRGEGDVPVYDGTAMLPSQLGRYLENAQDVAPDVFRVCSTTPDKAHDAIDEIIKELSSKENPIPFTVEQLEEMILLVY